MAQDDVGIAIGTGTRRGNRGLVYHSYQLRLRWLDGNRAFKGHYSLLSSRIYFCAFIYNVLGIPIAVGLLFPLTGWLSSPIIGSVAMSLTAVSVVANS